MEKTNGIKDALIFSTITLGCSFLLFWGPLAVFKIPTISFVADKRGPAWAIVLFVINGFVPSLTALILSRLREGKAGLRSLLRRFLLFNLGLRWYLAIAAVVLLGTAGQIAINSILGHGFEWRLFVQQLPTFLPLIILGPISEEFGWRGYLLAKFQQRFGALSSALVVGVIWALWHLPLFYMVGDLHYELQLPFAGFFVGTISISVVMTWLNNNTSASIWTAVLTHWLYTYSVQVVSSGITRSPLYSWLEYFPYLIIAILVVAVWKPRHLVRTTAADDCHKRS